MFIPVPMTSCSGKVYTVHQPNLNVFCFRPNKVAVHYANSTAKTYRTWLNSMSADGSLLLFTETDRTVSPSIFSLDILELFRFNPL